MLLYKKSLLLPLLLTILFLSDAFSSLSQEPAQYQKEPLAARLKQISEKHNIHLIYDANSISNQYAPAISRQQVSISELLNLSVKQAGLRARPVKNNTYILLPDPFGKLSGQIIDETLAEPIANVFVTAGQYNAVSDAKGRFEMVLPPGKYNVVFSHIGYGKKTAGNVSIAAGAATGLEFSLAPVRPQMQEVQKNVTITGETIVSHYVRRKAAATITDGLSSEQILASPNINVDDVLKRVNGVSSMSDKSIGIRGMSERYNEAFIDGIPMPGISINQRKFSFDIFPKEMIGSIVISKTALPDQNAGFSGGEIATYTLSIPNTDFTRVTIGSGTNWQNIAQNFYGMGKRDGLNFLGLNGKAGKQPGLGEINNNQLSVDPLKTHQFKAAPHYNASFALGRAYALNEKLNFGLVAGLSLRESQDRILTNNIRRTQIMQWDEIPDPASAPGTIYRFSSGMGGVLNLGLQGRRFNISLKNIYTTFLEDNYHETYRMYYDSSSVRFKNIFQEPVYSRLRQHKIEGQYNVSSFLNIAISGAVTDIRQSISDQRKFKYYGVGQGTGIAYNKPNIFRGGSTYYDIRDADSRLWLQKNETAYYAGASATAQLVRTTAILSKLKAGYNGWFKKATFTTLHIFPSIADMNYDIRGTYAILFADTYTPAQPTATPYYTVYQNGIAWSGQSDNNAFYLLSDNTFFKKLRLAGGIRAEELNFKVAGQVNSINAGMRGWLLKPSVNLRYAVAPKMNIRAAYFKTRLQPDFREASDFAIFDYELDGVIRGQQFTLTTVDNFDIRYEWFPAIDEIVSISGFSKKLKRPVEMLSTGEMGHLYYFNQNEATNMGVEIEIRKSLAFLNRRAFAQKLYFTGNATLNRSLVLEAPTGNYWDTKWTYRRPLFNQAPWVANAGLVYSGNVWGIGAWYNRSGPKTFIANNNPNFIEYENGIDLLDAQVYINLFKNKGKFVLNANNLLNPIRIYYINAHAFTLNYNTYTLTNGTTRYEKDKGDQVTFTTRSGMVLNASFMYNF